MTHAAEIRKPFLPTLLISLAAASIALLPALAVPLLLVLIAWWTLARPTRWIIACFAAALLLPPLPIPIGDAGPHPCLLFAALGLFFIPTLRIRLNALTALFAVLLASVALAAIHSGPA